MSKPKTNLLEDREKKIADLLSYCLFAIEVMYEDADSMGRCEADHIYQEKRKKQRIAFVKSLAGNSHG